ncbi:hypothetical protein FB567DRAFT_589417 [Paraphoma chrysanthemicola]|uniref:BTB domain-containing protein n=1 Tax=Paraphoma chrysanthemicola TaxID=798071 RepID=A0A8K0RFD5_9PLEO|nr:hypothetical protein FB567DRAFT_589417 [Paraphoma chrysanthemicola]
MVKKSKKGIVDPVVETQPPVEEFKVSDLQPQPDAPRPKTTPYATSPIALRIGPQQTPYYAPKRLLQNPDWVEFDNSWGNEIKLPDVDEGTGHVMIHYLYTGAYQTLDDIELAPTEAVRVEFRRAVMAYIAAKKYMLPGLQRLAGEQISTFGAEMSIFDVVEAINKDFSRIPDDATWFHEYMGDKVRMAFEQDATVFAKDDLFSRIDNVALIRVLVKVMVEVYTNKLSPVLKPEERQTPETPGERVVEERHLPSEEPPQVEGLNINEAPAKECQAEVFTTEGLSIKAAPAQEVLVQVPPGAGTVPGDDIQEVKPIKKLKKSSKKELKITKKKKKKDPATSSEAQLAEPEPTPGPVPEVEPVFEAEPVLGAVSVLSYEQVLETKLVTEGAEEVARTNSEPTQPKGKEHGTSSDVILAEPEHSFEPLPIGSEPTHEKSHEPNPEALSSDEIWMPRGVSISSKKKKSKKYALDKTEKLKADEIPLPVPAGSQGLDEYTEKLSAIEEMPQFPSEPVLEPEPESVVEEPPVNLSAELVQNAKKKKKIKKGAVLPPPPPAPPVFVPEPEPVVEELLPLAVEEPALNLAEHNKNCNEEVPATPSATPLPEPEPAITEGDEWGLSATWGGGKKKKKSKKAPAASLPPPPEPPIEIQDIHDPDPASTASMVAESAPVEETITAQPNEDDLPSSSGPVSPPVEPESPIEADIGYCPRRAKHIGKSDRWKTCEQCRTFLHQIAVEFVRTGSPIETGYEIVDHSSNVL